jgi:hypothetical protein
MGVFAKVMHYPSSQIESQPLDFSSDVTGDSTQNPSMSVVPKTTGAYGWRNQGIALKTPALPQ